MGNSFFGDLDKVIDDKHTKHSINVLQIFLEQLANEIIESGDFKKISLTTAST